jgi:hypothetical protein
LSFLATVSGKATTISSENAWLILEMEVESLLQLEVERPIPQEVGMVLSLGLRRLFPPGCGELIGKENSAKCRGSVIPVSSRYFQASPSQLSQSIHSL